MIVLARTIDPDARAVRKDNDDNVDAPMTKYSGQIAQLMFKLYGTSTYPDATFTLRISYGAVAGYQQGGRTIEPMSVIGGVFERATGAEPFKLPQSWLAARSRLNLQQPFNMVTSNDIIGGNSGSPLVNKAGARSSSDVNAHGASSVIDQTIRIRVTIIVARNSMLL